MTSGKLAGGGGHVGPAINPDAATTRCFACDRKGARHLVDTRDAQTVYVGRECFKKIQAGGPDGYQPPLGGPRLYLMPEK